MLVVTLVLVDHASEHGGEANWGLTLQHKLIEVCSALFFKHDSHGAFGLANSTATTTTFNIRCTKENSATNSDSSYVHLLRVATTLYTLGLQFVKEFEDKFGSLLINCSECTPSINQTLASDDRADSIQLPHTIVHVFLHGRPSAGVSWSMSHRVEANWVLSCTSLFKSLIEQITLRDFLVLGDFDGE